MRLSALVVAAFCCAASCNAQSSASRPGTSTATSSSATAAASSSSSSSANTKPNTSGGSVGTVAAMPFEYQPAPAECAMNAFCPMDNVACGKCFGEAMAVCGLDDGALRKKNVKACANDKETCVVKGPSESAKGFTLPRGQAFCSDACTLGVITCVKDGLVKCGKCPADCNKMFECFSTKGFGDSSCHNGKGTCDASAFGGPSPATGPSSSPGSTGGGASSPGFNPDGSGSSKGPSDGFVETKYPDACSAALQQDFWTGMNAVHMAASNPDCQAIMTKPTTSKDAATKQLSELNACIAKTAAKDTAVCNFFGWTGAKPCCDHFRTMQGGEMYTQFCNTCPKRDKLEVSGEHAAMLKCSAALETNAATIMAVTCPKECANTKDPQACWTACVKKKGNEGACKLFGPNGDGASCCGLGFGAGDSGEGDVDLDVVCSACGTKFTPLVTDTATAVSSGRGDGSPTQRATGGSAAVTTKKVTANTTTTTKKAAVTTVKTTTRATTKATTKTTTKATTKTTSRATTTAKATTKMTTRATTTAKATTKTTTRATTTAKATTKTTTKATTKTTTKATTKATTTKATTKATTKTTAKATTRAAAVTTVKATTRRKGLRYI